MKPITKKQTILKAIGEADASKLPKPSTKLETYLYIVCKGSGKIPEPTTREEIYLAYWAAQNGGTGYSKSTLPKPVTRKEVILNALAKGESTSIETFSRYETYLKVAANGVNGKYPVPQTVEEYYLLFFAQNMKGDNTPYMYYGRLSFQDVGGAIISYSQITEAMIKKGVTDGKLTKETPKTKGKTSMGAAGDTAEGDYIVMVVPTAKNYTVTKDNGIGGKVPFDEETAGANGIDITINSVPCKLYGETLLSQGEMFLYVD